MNKKLQISPSGNPLVDMTWGGFYRGGTYFLLGPRKSGKTVFALQFAMQALSSEKETCLYFSSFRPKDLMINAVSIDIDLQHYISQNLFTLVRVTPVKNIELANNPDSYLTEYIKDLKSVVDKYNPDRIVFDELTEFVGYKDPALLREAFLETVDYIENKGVTSLFLIREPATSAANKIVSTLLSLSTGKIVLEKKEGLLNKNNPGKMIITPNVGHVEGEFSCNYYIEPDKGIKVDYKPEIIVKKISSSETKNSHYTAIEDSLKLFGSFSPASIYNLNEFKLLLNNQIAFYKETGIVSTLIAVKLENDALKNKIINVDQLANAIRTVIDKKDKICILKNMLLILFTKEERDADALVPLVLDNLSKEGLQYLSKVAKYISIYSVKMDRGTQNAEDMFRQLLAADIPDENKIGLN